ncbi:Kelch repeat-containing protein [Candidatus Binatus sp.]|uniref:Kelch repeat-containing protein n=1 Tax=Candidatus Binatus sp. TaxID=2811406 RepID=UPI002F94F372
MMMTKTSKRSKRNLPAAMWALSLLFVGLLAVLPAAGEQADSSSPARRGMLLAGGFDQFNGPTATAEFYSFKTKTFSCKFLGGVNSATGACNNTLAQARFYASVAPLPGGGALIAGGNGVGTTCLNSAEIYNSSTGKFTATGSMTDAHCFAHTTTVLQNGEVLITGGEDETGNLVNTADMYNPSSGKFDCSGLGGADPTTGYCQSTLTDARFHDTATLLEDGRVLIAGGFDGSIVNTAELFDPGTGTFTATSGTMTDSRENHTAALMVTGPRAGDVLIAGGLDADGNVLQTAELYSPTAGNFTATTSMTHARYLHTATQLDPTYVKGRGRHAGNILITGGEDGTGTVLATAEMYDPVALTFTQVGAMTTARALHTAVLITSGPKKGLVLIAGGIDNNGKTLNTAELFNPKTGKFTAIGSMQVGRSSQDGTALP